MNSILSVVTVDDLRTYFSGKRWEGGGWKGDSFDGSIQGVVDVKLWPEGLAYWVKIEAVDDPSDSEEMSTEKPLKAIADFLGQDLPGGEHFDRMSASPAWFAAAVETAATSIRSGGLGRRRAMSVLRRLSLFSRTARSDVPDTKGAIPELEEQARRKGWKVKTKRGENGDEVLEIDVSGVYRAEVSVDSVMYGYSFSVRGADVGEEGKTEDPIREFEKWSRDADVTDAAESAREESVSKRTVQAPEDDGGMRTIPAPEDQAKKTVHSPEDRRRPPARRAPMEEPLS